MTRDRDEEDVGTMAAIWAYLLLPLLAIIIAAIVFTLLTGA